MVVTKAANNVWRFVELQEKAEKAPQAAPAAAGRRRCDRRASWPPSLSLGRSA
jgi:hypothetical protein